MKVIQLVPELNSGGVERGTLEIGQYLAQNRHESLVVSSGGRLVDTLEKEGSRHITLPVHKKSLSSLSQIKVLRQLFEDEKPDILHLRSRVPAWLAYKAWQKMDPQTRPRLITTVHGFYSVNSYSKIMTRGESVICVSESVKDYVLTNYKEVPADKLTVIHRGVSSVEYAHGYKPPPDWAAKFYWENPQLENKFLVTLPARITRWKGQLDVLRILDGLKRQCSNVHFLIVGESHPKKKKFRKELEKAIKANGATDFITLMGHRSDLREVMAISAAVISLSRDPEAFGRVTLEALKLGRPVAAYDHGGVHEQLQALLPEGKVPVGDTLAMSEKLAQYRDKPASPIESDAFSLEQMQAQTLECYEALLAKPR
ncbi:MAG: glycosyltransferase family 4 protein [Coraliomargarita sp.]